MQAKIDALLQGAVAKEDLYAASFILTNREEVLYQGAYAAAGQAAVTEQTVFSIYSMTKAITAAAAMQLVEQGKLELDEPAGNICPELGGMQVLQGFDEDGMPRLRDPVRPVTLRRLLTHTSGLVYEIWNADLQEYVARTNMLSIDSLQKSSLNIPLMFDPGERWEYGIGIDWVGQMIEAVSGMTLGEYLHEYLTGPLQMTDTSFAPSATMTERMIPVALRQADGSLLHPEAAALNDGPVPEFEMGGGGLVSTLGDYAKFMRMILAGGELNGVRVLQQSTVQQMAVNQMGDLRVTPIESHDPIMSNDVDLFPGVEKSWGFSFLINETQGPDGRPAGTLMWAGLGNLYFWIDLENDLAAAFMTQVLPFGDAKCLALVAEIERAIYQTV